MIHAARLIDFLHFYRLLLVSCGPFSFPWPSKATVGFDSGIMQLLADGTRGKRLMRRQNTFIGSPVERVEDLRFLRGRGQYVDDLHRQGLWHAVMVRSPVA